MFCVQIRYFLHSLDEILILLECLEAISKTFKCFGSRWDIFRMFWIQDIFFSTFSCINKKLFEVFESKQNTFQTCSVEFRYILNYLGTKPDTFQMFWVWIKFFSNVHYQIRYFSNVLLKNSILFGCFGSQSDTFSMFWTELL